MIRNLIPNKVCLGCFGCCRFSEKDSVWPPHLLNSEEKVFKKIGLIFDPTGRNFLCSFLDPRKNKCRIYRQRPFECRLYPFLLCRKGGKVFLSADLNCRYLEKHLQADKVKKYISSLLKFLNSKKFLKVLKDNPQIAQEYPGLVDIAEIGNA